MAYWTYVMVEERLVEAICLWRRAPDRERGWQHIRAYWPDLPRHRHDGDGEANDWVHAPEPRQLPLSRAEVAAMTEASEWLRFVPDRDRKLVSLAVEALADGDSQVPWTKLKRRLGVSFGVHGLRKRYSRAITSIANALNVAKNRADGVSS